MSAFLGPIHYLMFSKIQWQDELCRFLTKKVEKILLGFEEQITEHTFSLPEGDLQDIIDQSNIHGSLQEMIGLVEHKLAYIAAQAIKRTALSITELAEYAKEYGKDRGIKNKMTAQEAYQFLFGKLLNGMPCDRVQELVEKEENRVVWRDTMDIHSAFWTEQGLDGAIFYQLRAAMITGILEESGVSFRQEKPFYYVLYTEQEKHTELPAMEK